MPTKTWTESDLASLVHDAVEENLSLEYKAAKAVFGSDGAKREMTKDVSALANSAGGTIIYGMKEYDDPPHRHLPERIDPVDRVQYSREWMEQVIGRVQPRISGLVIQSVGLKASPSHCVYVVDVPASDTAHQAADFRYYKRFNFQSVPMADYEVRDVMGRRTHPAITLDFAIEHSSVAQLVVIARNTGRLFANYINAFIEVPESMLLPDTRTSHVPVNGYCRLSCDNTVQDVLDVRFLPGDRPLPQYGPSRFVPILPGISRVLKNIDINPLYFRLQPAGTELWWSVYADNAPPCEGRVRILDVERLEREPRA